MVLLISKYQIPCLILVFNRKWELKREEMALVDKNTSLQTGVGGPFSKRQKSKKYSISKTVLVVDTDCYQSARIHIGHQRAYDVTFNIQI